MTQGKLVEVADTRLFVAERGDAGGFPLIVLHGGPGLDHHEFADYLDPLTEGGRYRLVLVDERAQGCSDRSAPPHTWTIERMAADVTDLAAALGLPSYAVLGHSFGSFLALQHAVDFPGAAVATIVSSGVASARWMARVPDELARFEPVELREQVRSSWDREASAETEADAAALMADQMPFHFADPRDPRIGDYLRRTEQTRYAPEVLRAAATSDYGGIEVEERLASVGQPVLVLAGRHDRVCSAEAAQDMASRLPAGELVVFEHSGHMTFVEEQERYLGVVRAFLDHHAWDGAG
ncbi:MAG TPA: alpha/beta fold hydrolase [Streptosporangiaceae bacterium]|nr:alpha/beta fold hydrolase [Streptosporangiaceae bacterium]